MCPNVLSRRDEILANLAEVEAEIATAATAAGRAPEAVQLLAVTKTWPVEDLQILRDLRPQLAFGENRVQELLAKMDVLGTAVDDPNAPTWHLIGTLQRKKVKQIIGRCALIHSVDRDELIDELAKRSAEAGVVTPILLQCNPAEEESKHGYALKELAAAVEKVLAEASLDLQGLMCMAPISSSPDEARPVFAACRAAAEDLARRYGAKHFQTLSMGMSSDFHAAILEGATIVRIGSRIFGPRDYR